MVGKTRATLLGLRWCGCGRVTTDSLYENYSGCGTKGGEIHIVEQVLGSCFVCEHHLVVVGIGGGHAEDHEEWSGGGWG